MRWLRCILLAAVFVAVTGMAWAIRDDQESAVRQQWAIACPRVGLARGVRGTIGTDSVRWGSYSQFTAPELTRLRAMFDSLGVAYGDTVAGFVARRAVEE